MNLTNTLLTIAMLSSTHENPITNVQVSAGNVSVTHTRPISTSHEARMIDKVGNLSTARGNKISAPFN